MSIRQFKVLFCCLLYYPLFMRSPSFSYSRATYWACSLLNNNPATHPCCYLPLKRRMCWVKPFSYWPPAVEGWVAWAITHTSHFQVYLEATITSWFVCQFCPEQSFARLTHPENGNWQQISKLIFVEFYWKIYTHSKIYHITSMPQHPQITDALIWTT